MQGAIPYVSDEQAAECNVAQRRLRRRSACRSSTARARACNWQTDADGVAPGTFPPDQVPTLFRDDYVHNGNDSHWLTNPEAADDRLRPDHRRSRTPSAASAPGSG